MNRYTEEFKKEAVKQIVERGYKVKDVAENLGVSQPSLNRWMKQFAGDRPHDNTKAVDKDAEIARLKAKLKQTEEERDILKKAAVYFANHPE